MICVTAADLWRCWYWQATEKTPGFLEQVETFQNLDTASITIICGRIKTLTFPKSFAGKDVSREAIVRRGEVAQDMVLMLSGQMNITVSQHEPTVQQFLLHDEDAASDWEKVLRVGKSLDWHVCMLPPYQLHHRTVTGYAYTECQIGLLSAEDIASIAAHRPQVRQHVKVQADLARKMLTRRKCKALFGKIDSACVLAFRG